ncbi:hypothetical protein VT84_16270 [Gemmata sp. SH-PL17]|uniref:hypothetical protein n=1 Tax=Gemmata sp. SH-PL17 TaxID=1630693 RepID=UPI00078B971A|nr:hypothetical protein [Gemmata sp. SH-PL17]AMV25955.1 hypothetical protein VT84_16270 [Gemmata sp. SH-PL17]
MTTDHRPDSRSRRPLTTFALTAGLFAIGAAVLVGASGCTKPPTGVKNTEEQPTTKGDPWKVAGQRLRKETDWAACRTALGGLATDLNTQTKETLPVLSDPEFASLSQLVPLSADDREEVRATTFTAHDSAYLADCLYLRDAADSLALGRFPPDQRAERAFAWVCRQVYLRPWMLIAGRADGASALPPTAVLRRGFGSGLERMYVFLALLQQLELDGCLIGGPDAGKQPAGLPLVTPDNKAFVTGAPRGPFWAVGVRIGADVKLFDPWRGQAFPVTLAQLKANPDAAKEWFADQANVSGATLDDAKKATAFLAVPVNALAPRMGLVETKLKSDLGVKLAYDAKALQSAFRDPKPAFWNPSNEPNQPNQRAAFAYGHASRALLPLDMGGTDRNPPGVRLFDVYRREQLPNSVFRIPAGIQPDGQIAQRLRAGAAGALGLSFIEPPNPRERIQRGQFQDAAKDLVTKQETFANGRERLRLNKDAGFQIKEWVELVTGLYQELGRVQLDANRDKSVEAAVLGQIDSAWKQPGVQLIVDQASSEVGLAESTLLLALCKHELAERSQARLEAATGAEADRLRPDAIDAWKTALSAWRTYEQNAVAHAGFPGRSEHARVLAARAALLANPAPPKK